MTRGFDRGVISALGRELGFEGGWLWGSDNGWRGGDEGGQFLDSRGGSSRSESKYLLNCGGFHTGLLFFLNE